MGHIYIIWIGECLAYFLCWTALMRVRDWRMVGGIILVQGLRYLLMAAHYFIIARHADYPVWWADVNHIDLVLDVWLCWILATSRLKWLGYAYALGLCMEFVEYLAVDNGALLADRPNLHCADFAMICDFLLALAVYICFVRQPTQGD